MKLNGIAHLYMQSYAWQELSVNSKKTYKFSMRYMDDIMRMEANDIKRPQIIALKDQLYQKRAVCRNVMAVLNNILTFGYDRGFCEFNHARGVRGQPRPQSMKRWTPDECDRFLDGAPFRLKLAFYLAVYTGQRRGDLVKMEWTQIEGNTIIVVQEKTRRYLRIPIHPMLMEVLNVARKMTRSDPYILHNAWGQPMTGVALTAMFHQRLKTLGIKERSLHGLRKTAGSALAEAGCSTHMIASILGHKTLKETAHYTEEADQLVLATEAMSRWAAQSAGSSAISG